MSIGIEATKIGVGIKESTRKPSDLIFSSKYHNLIPARVLLVDNTGWLPGDPELVIPHGLDYPPMMLAMIRVAESPFVQYQAVSGYPFAGGFPIQVDKTNVYARAEVYCYLILFFEPTNERY